MNAACALGLCVAGLCGQLRKLSFGVSACYAGLAPPVVHLGWVACSGDVFPDLFSEFDLSMALSTAAFVSDVVSTLSPAVARRRDDYRRLAGAERILNGEEAVLRWGQRPLQPLRLPQV